MTHITMPGNMMWSILALIYCTITCTQGESSVSMVFGGDISFNGILEYMVNKDHCTYEESLEKLKPVFKGIDFVVANLESIVYKEADNENAKIYGPKITRPANTSNIHSIQDLSALKALKNVGINTVSVANSHIGHFSVAADQLKSHKIKYFGLSSDNNHTKQKPLILEKNGVKVGLLGYCMTKECKKAKKDSVGAVLLNVKTVIKQAKKLRKKGAHAVILFLNWGRKYQSVISPNGILTIRKIIKEVKIDLIVGTHPGVTHAHWIVNQTLVASSLGNLLSTPFMTAAMNFEPKYMNLTNQTWLPSYEKLWHKQMKTMDDPSRYGKLLKVQIDQNGLVVANSTFLKTRITSTNKHCLVVDKENWTDIWREVCQLDDSECAGTKDCNFIECDAMDPLPIELTQINPEKWTTNENLKTASGHPDAIPIKTKKIKGKMPAPPPDEQIAPVIPCTDTSVFPVVPNLDNLETAAAQPCSNSSVSPLLSSSDNSEIPILTCTNLSVSSVVPCTNHPAGPLVPQPSTDASLTPCTKVTPFAARTPKLGTPCGKSVTKFVKPMNRVKIAHDRRFKKNEKMKRKGAIF